MLSQDLTPVRHRLESFIPSTRLYSDPLRTLAYGSDASFYRLTPNLVVDANDEEEVSRILRIAGESKTPITFRAAGTSLSGQAVTDALLLRLGHGWQGAEVSADASTIRLQPGVIGERANVMLAPFNKKIGPDPASINAAKIGGIAANNASGMCCGTAQNSYHTLASMRIILADGTVLDTADRASREAFAATHRKLLERLEELGRRTRANAALAERIRKKFKIKNTTGYSLNALVDFEDPLEILQHLMIGSEGTLGFIAEITLRTVDEHPFKASALALFADIRTACEAVAMLKTAPVSAVELMDRAALRSVQGKPGIPAYLSDLSSQATALLVETRAGGREALQDQIASIDGSVHGVTTLSPIEFTDEEAEYTRLWGIRKGLFPSVGAMRQTGTTVIIEDVAFEVPRLASATVDLQTLLDKHGYQEAIIFGHALEGNVHFVFTQDFGSSSEVGRYRNFMDAVCDMVVSKYDGSLKAEHSTGRNMAPFVEFEWGREAYELMREIKALFDPQGILNPGVILNEDREAHIKHLKALPAADPLVDRCTECGFCEPNCPSRALTLTPRQRIVGLRELARMEADPKDSEKTKQLRALYQYQAVDTCAGDGLCAVACPVDIDTGRMIKGLRGRQVPGLGHKVADVVANRFGAVATATRLGLGAAGVAQRVLGNAAMRGISRGVRRLSGNRAPLWTQYMPSAARARKVSAPEVSGGQRVVYFPSCASRTMGPARGDPEFDVLPDKMTALLQKAGYEVVCPADCETLCCGTPFESKGLGAHADAKLRETEQALLAASDDGRNMVVCDTSLCALRLKQNVQLPLALFDITEFIHDQLLDRLIIEPQAETVAIHATCSTLKMNLGTQLRAIAQRCVKEVIVPDNIRCCGWAGDKGFSHPELNASALRELRDALPPACSAGYSTSRTCEIGLSEHSGRYYRSIAYLVDRCSAAKPNVVG